MTMEEYRGIVAYLRRNFPNAKKYQDRDTLNDGWGLVKGYNAEEIMATIHGYMVEKPYPPDMAELARMAAPAEEEKREYTFRVQRGNVSYIKKFADGVGVVPCPLCAAHTRDESGALTVGQAVRKYFPAPECDGCIRHGDAEKCWGLQFGGDG